MIARRQGRPEATTTSYALLGMLAMRPFTAYELTQQSKRSFRFFWPRSEANLYAEPKRLVRLGWARAVPQKIGQRTRTSYEITSAGRHALRAWLSTPPGSPLIEVEGLLRLLHADQGSIKDLRAALYATHAQAIELLDAGRAEVEDYLGAAGPFSQRLHIIALLGAGCADIIGALADWCTLALDETSRWPSTVDFGMTPATRRLLEQTLQRYRNRLPPLEQRGE